MKHLSRLRNIEEESIFNWVNKFSSEVSKQV